MSSGLKAAVVHLHMNVGMSFQAIEELFDTRYDDGSCQIEMEGMDGYDLPFRVTRSSAHRWVRSVSAPECVTGD